MYHLLPPNQYHANLLFKHLEKGSGANLSSFLEYNHQFLIEKFKEWKERDEEIERLNHPDGIPCVDGPSSSYRKLYQENLDLKAKLSRLQNPDATSYTDEEIEAMDYEAANQENDIDSARGVA